MASRHKVVTFERQGGFAARCEVERDGEVLVCAATFGGFRNRTEARAALHHDEVEL